MWWNSSSSLLVRICGTRPFVSSPSFLPRLILLRSQLFASWPCCSTFLQRFIPPSRLPIPILSRRSEEHTSELQSLMRISYAVFCLKKKTHILHHCTINKLDKHHELRSQRSHNNPR